MIDKIIDTAFYGFWHFIGMFLMIYNILGLLVNMILRMWSRFFRSMMVRKHGWPPDYLDSDGDHIEEIKLKYKNQ